MKNSQDRPHGYALLSQLYPPLAQKKATIFKVLPGTEVFKRVEEYLLKLEESESIHNFTVSVVYQKNTQRDSKVILENGFHFISFHFLFSFLISCFNF